MPENVDNYGLCSLCGSSMSNHLVATVTERHNGYEIIRPTGWACPPRKPIETVLEDPAMQHRKENPYHNVVTSVRSGGTPPVAECKHCDFRHEYKG